MKQFLILIFSICSFLAYSQDVSTDKIKLRLIDEEGQSLPGARVFIEGMVNHKVFDTDFDGETTIEIPKDKDEIRLSLLCPTVIVKIVRPVDSILINLKSREARYFYKGKQVKKRKVKVRSR